MTAIGLPEGLADMTPGPALSAALAGLDPQQMANSDTVTVLVARYRQLAHEQARLLEALVEVGRSNPDDLSGTRRLDAVGEWASGEIAAALTLTGVAADRELAFADTVVTGLPLVHAALTAGSLDRPKAWVFADHLADVPADQAAAICAALLPVAPELTTGQLRARLARMLHDIDPEHARRRYQRAVRERAVIGYLAPDGTVTITANGLPADEAAVACERLDTLAHAVQRAGHPGRLGQIQTDLFLGMLDGSLHHLTEPQIISTLLNRPRPEDTEPAEPPAPATAAPAAPTADTESPAAAAPTPETESQAATAPTGTDPPAGTGHAKPEHAEAAQPAAAPHTEAASPADTCDEPCTEAASHADAGAGAGAGAGATSEPQTGVEIRVGLTTLLHLDDQCGEIPGLGSILPGIARALVNAQYLGAEWRFAITDADGLLLFAGTTRRRPTIPATNRGRCRGGIVELHIDADTLKHLTSTYLACDPWAGVIADLAHQYTHRANPLALIDQHVGNRFARAALARHIEIRDRTCCHPGCRRPARKADKDHTHDHAAGGPTTSDNIGPLCERHHRYKSLGWWTLTQPHPGRFRWTSPLTRSYRTRGEPIRPPTVSPLPRPTQTIVTGLARRTSGPILRRTPHPPRRTEPTTPADEPPF
jgi:hypothetical protein